MNPFIFPKTNEKDLINETSSDFTFNLTRKRKDFQLIMES